MIGFWILVWLCGWFLGFRALTALDKTETVGGLLMNAITAFVFWIPIAIIYVIVRIANMVFRRVVE